MVSYLDITEIVTQNEQRNFDISWSLQLKKIVAKDGRGSSILQRNYNNHVFMDCLQGPLSLGPGPST